MTYQIPLPSLVDGTAPAHLRVGSSDLTFPAPDPGWLGELARSLRARWHLGQDRATAAVIRILEAVLPGLYLRSVAAADEALGGACAAVWWAGGDEAVEAAVLPHVEAVVAFGGEAALRSLAGRLPSHVRFQPHGHRVGFGLVSRE